MMETSLLPRNVLDFEYGVGNGSIKGYISYKEKGTHNTPSIVV